MFGIVLQAGKFTILLISPQCGRDSLNCLSREVGLLSIGNVQGLRPVVVQCDEKQVDSHSTIQTTNGGFTPFVRDRGRFETLFPSCYTRHCSGPQPFPIEGEHTSLSVHLTGNFVRFSARYQSKRKCCCFSKANANWCFSRSPFFSFNLVPGPL